MGVERERGSRRGEGRGGGGVKRGVGLRVRGVGEGRDGGGMGMDAIWGRIEGRVGRRGPEGTQQCKWQGWESVLMRRRGRKEANGCVGATGTAVRCDGVEGGSDPSIDLKKRFSSASRGIFEVASTKRQVHHSPNVCSNGLIANKARRSSREKERSKTK